MTLFVIDNSVIRFGDYRCHGDWARSLDSRLCDLKIWGRVDLVENGIWLFRDEIVNESQISVAIDILQFYFPRFPIVRREVAWRVDDPCDTRGRVGW